MNRHAPSPADRRKERQHNLSNPKCYKALVSTLSAALKRQENSRQENVLKKEEVRREWRRPPGTPTARSGMLRA